MSRSTTDALKLPPEDLQFLKATRAARCLQKALWNAICARDSTVFRLTITCDEGRITKAHVSHDTNISLGLSINELNENT